MDFTGKVAVVAGAGDCDGPAARSASVILIGIKGACEAAYAISFAWWNGVTGADLSVDDDVVAH